MRAMELHWEHVVPRDLETVFDFHADPRNLERLHAGWPGFRPLGNSGSILPGAVTRVELAVFRLPLALGFEHTGYDRPHSFEERLMHGVFDTFHHVHEFERRDGATLVIDRVTIRLPWWLGGELSTRWFVRPRLQTYFAFRHRSLDQLVRQGEMGLTVPS